MKVFGLKEQNENLTGGIGLIKSLISSEGSATRFEPEKRISYVPRRDGRVDVHCHGLQLKVPFQARKRQAELSLKKSEIKNPRFISAQSHISKTLRSERPGTSQPIHKKNPKISIYRNIKPKPTHRLQNPQEEHNSNSHYGSPTTPENLLEKKEPDVPWSFDSNNFPNITFIKNVPTEIEKEERMVHSDHAHIKESAATVNQFFNAGTEVYKWGDSIIEFPLTQRKRDSIESDQGDPKIIELREEEKEEAGFDWIGEEDDEDDGESDLDEFPDEAVGLIEEVFGLKSDS